MLIPALRQNNKRRQVSTTASLPAPTGGWNARDSLAAMAPEDAVQMDNYIPGTATVDLRGGSSRYTTITGVRAPVETLISYANGSATNFLAATNGKIFDVSNGGMVSVPLSSGYTSNRWQYENMGGYALLFNGVDTPQKYNGSTVADNTFTGSGLTPSNLIYPCLFKHRLFIIEKNTMNVWYGTLDAITGSLSKLDFSTYCKLGGYMVAMGSITRDGGSGPDDYAIFLTSRGEVLVYQGTDPANSTTWEQVGVFRSGVPIGQRPLLKFGADLVVISEDGFEPLSKIMPLDRIGAELYSLSDKIRQAAIDATTSYATNFGWEGILYPKKNWILFNIPLTENTAQQQYVLNTLNNNWCRFIGMNANCWGVFNKDLYFGSNNGLVVKADIGAGDDDLNLTSQGSTAIQGDIKTSFQYFGQRGKLKHFKMIRPVIASNGAVNISVAINVDYEDITPTSVSTPTRNGAVWDVSPWDITPWGVGKIIRKGWIGASAMGYSAALHMRTLTSGIDISLNSIDWLYEPGGVL